MQRRGTGAVIGPRGELLWPTPARAHAYAVARYVLYGNRQRVVPVRQAGGRLLWQVRCARPERQVVAEPCS